MDNQYSDSGTLFRNDRKEAGSKQPDYTGKLDITCESCGNSFTRKLSAWLKEARSGRKFLSLSCKPRENRLNGQDLDEEIRF